MDLTGECVCFACAAKLVPPPAAEPDAPSHLPTAGTMRDRECVFIFLPPDAPNFAQEELEDVARTSFSRDQTVGAVFITYRLPHGSEDAQRNAMMKKIDFWVGMQADPQTVLIDQKIARWGDLQFSLIRAYNVARR